MDNLDAQELLHLAMFAASKENHDDALGYLKQALAQEETNPNITLMLAAEYAEIGMYERALEFFDKTILLAPELKVAQLQASLLLITLDRLEPAQTHLAELIELGEANYFGLFALGLQALIDEKLENAKAFLQKARELNQENLPLNDDINKIIEQIELRLNQTNSDMNDDNEHDSNDLLMSTYKH